MDKGGGNSQDEESLAVIDPDYSGIAKPEASIKDKQKMARSTSAPPKKNKEIVEERKEIKNRLPGTRTLPQLIINDD